MKTKQDLISEGYSSDWMVQCRFCGSFNCHDYTDLEICFDCNSKLPMAYINKINIIFGDRAWII